MLLILLSITVSHGYRITLDQPMIVKTQDGSKYLFHPKSSAEENQETESDDVVHGECTWGQWGEFTNCELVPDKYSKNFKGKLYL